MNNDLISREDLKNALNYIYDCAYINSKSKEGIASDIIAEIDQAPSVPLPDFKAGYKQAIIDGKTNFSRPRGEWNSVIKANYGNNVFNCNNCYAIFTVIEGANKMHFCPNCGADMRGGAE